MGKIKTKSSLDAFTKLGIFASSLLVTALAVYFYSPVIKTHADEDTNFEVKAVINSIVSLELDTDNLKFSIVPTESGTFDSKSITATVSTNSPTGYELYFSSENNETSMVNTIPSITDTVDSNFSGTVTSSTMAANNWGYSLDNTDFSKIPTLSSHATIRNLNHRPGNASEKNSTVYIGTKISSSIQSGTYYKSVKFSAVAHELPELPFNGITKMQDMTPALCSAAVTGETATLRDIRDGNSYTVKKLADGRCWMTQNLKIANKTISSTDSNLPAGKTFTIPASNVSDFTTAYNTNAAYLDSTYGGYYNFYTATAGTGGTSLSSGNAPSDICPKGWSLPTGGSTGEFQTLYNNYNSAALMMDVPNFTLSGLVYNGSVDYQGSGGLFWSSTVDGANLAYSLGLNSSNVYPADNNDKYRGFSVRCVVPEPAPAMQDFDSNSLPNTGDSTILRDARDGKEYTVKRLADGRVWMTQNLNIVNKTITSADSNLPEGESWTVPASNISTFTNAFNVNSAYSDSDGGYYSYYAATAGWGTGGDDEEAVVTSGKSPKDICPKGWEIPSIGVLDNLYDVYDNDPYQLVNGDPNFVFAGIAHNGYIHRPGEHATYWASSVADKRKGYNMDIIENGGLGVDSSGFDKFDGLAIRCVAKTPSMQAFNKSTLANVGDSIKLEDERDGKMYNVKKLADGNVWMTENLRISGKSISSDDSNLPEDESFYIPGSDIDDFTTDYNKKAVYYDSTYGGYYNFYTATAGWGTDSVMSGNAPKDICPKDWRLPTGGSSGEFQALYNQYNSSASMQGDPGFILSGYVGDGSVSGQGSLGYFWSSTVANANRAYSLSLDSSGVYPVGSSNKRDGYSVRCMAK